MTERKKVFVGVSGGVDSSVSLALLKQQGYDVTGVFLKVWHPDFLPCNWREERRDAMRVCATLGVPFMTLDCEAEYKKEVADYMIAEYKMGRTPNPDIFCNKYVKFGVFLKKALAMGANFIATGHYAQVMSVEGVYALKEGADKEKDQSYFLYTLTQDQLAHTLFPVGHLQKSEVRKLAEEFHLPTAQKKDSQGVCFLGDIDMSEFLSHYIDTKQGDVLSTSGEVIGYHDGALLYTIGARRGYTITKKTPYEPRYFVISKDIGANTITVASKDSQSEKVFSTKSVVISNLHLINPSQSIDGMLCAVRFRYRQEKKHCVVNKKDGGYEIVFQDMQQGVAVGQSAVLYIGDVCIGGGIIEEILSFDK